MADEKTASVSRAKVSPARNAASVVLLLIVGIIGFIELRAALGHMMSGKALAARAPDGEFTDLPLAEAVGLLKMAPAPVIENRGLDSMYRYEWYSVLRPFIGKQSPQITIVVSNDEKPMALAFTTADEEPAPAPVPAAPGSASSPSPMPGGMMAPGGGPGSGTGEGADGRKRPEMEESDESAVAPETDSVSTPAAPPAAATETPEPTATPAADAPAADPAASGNP